MVESLILSAPETPFSCQIWTLTRRDGTAVYLTDHDKPFVVDGETYWPGVSLTWARFSSTTDLRPGEADVEGALSSAGISEEDVGEGAWDGAQIDVALADWQAGTLITQIWSGRFSEIRTEGEAISASLISLKADFDRVLGRNYSRRCDATLGDVRCGVDLSDPTYQGQTCDQRFETCTGRFQNGDRFRGCPHMPGNDFMLAAPGKAERR